MNTDNTDNSFVSNRCPSVFIGGYLSCSNLLVLPGWHMPV